MIGCWEDKDFARTFSAEDSLIKAREVARRAIAALLSGLNLNVVC